MHESTHRELAAAARSWGVAAAVALGVFASRAWLAGAWGSPLPFWDEWDAEPPLYRAWLEGRLAGRDLFAAHNEHRIALTRLANLAILGLGGTWNVWWQLILNAVLHAATAGALVVGFWPAFAPRLRAAFCAAVALLLAAPAGWQNALHGFQSQVAFANLLAVVAIVSLVPAEPLTRRWWLGWAAALLGLFSNAGGVLAVPAVLLATFPGRGGPPARPRTVAAWLLLGGLLAAAILLQVAPPGHAAFHARTLAQFLGTFARAASWPWVNSAWPWLLLQLPLPLLIVARWRSGEAPDAVERCALALGCLALLQAAAIAWTRGGILPDLRPLSRHQDPLLLGSVAQLFAAWRLALAFGRPGRLATAGWIALLAVGLLRITETNLAVQLPFKRAHDEANTARLRAYLAAPPAERPAHEPGLGGLHPDPAVVRRVLEDPVLRPILPDFLRQPVPRPLPPAIFRHGLVFTLASAGLLLALLAATARNPTRPPT